jgi:hypothetical protein
MNTKKEIVYTGVDDFIVLDPPIDLPEPVDDEKPSGFEAVFYLDDLDELPGRYFRYAQALCVYHKSIQWWSANTVFVPYRAIRWLLCFPIEKQRRRYVPVMYVLPPSGDDIFYCFTDTDVAPDGAPIRAVPDLDSLKFLSPSAASQLALVRASHWRWNKGRHTVLIRPQDVLQIETVRYSKIRTFF